jgi:hypothetical protein
MTRTAARTCVRMGCTNLVNKSTAKYCSIRCCAQDPERQERLRRVARGMRIYPMAHQLNLTFQSNAGSEASLDRADGLREDAPLGMQRLAVS